MTKIPNPGSPRAIFEECTCPRLDNLNGEGCWGDGIHFWINHNCPLHGKDGLAWRKQTIREKARKEKEKVTGVIQI